MIQWLNGLCLDKLWVLLCDHVNDGGVLCAGLLWPHLGGVAVKQAPPAVLPWRSKCFAFSWAKYSQIDKMLVIFLPLKCSFILSFCCKFKMRGEREREREASVCVWGSFGCLFKASGAVWLFLHCLSDIITGLFWPQLAGESEVYLRVHLQEDSVFIKIVRRKMREDCFSWIVDCATKPLSPHWLLVYLW